MEPRQAKFQEASSPLAQVAALHAGEPLHDGEAAVFGQQQNGPGPAGNAGGQGGASGMVDQLLSLGIGQFDNEAGLAATHRNLLVRQ